MPGLADNDLGEGSIHKLRVSRVIKHRPRAIVASNEGQDRHL
jgi:hypothetical protein